MVLADTTFLNVFWYSILFFFWIMAIWIFIALISDVIRRDDLSGGKKAVWIVFMVILPFVGCLTYIIARPKMTAQDVRMATQAEAAQRAAAGSRLRTSWRSSASSAARASSMTRSTRVLKKKALA